MGEKDNFYSYVIKVVLFAPVFLLCVVKVVSGDKILPSVHFLI